MESPMTCLFRPLGRDEVRRATGEGLTVAQALERRLPKPEAEAERAAQTAWDKQPGRPKHVPSLICRLSSSGRSDWGKRARTLEKERGDGRMTNEGGLMQRRQPVKLRWV